MKETTAKEISVKFGFSENKAHRRITMVKEKLGITNRKISLEEYCQVFKIKLEENASK